MNSRTAQSKLIKRARLILSGHGAPLYKFVMGSQRSTARQLYASTTPIP